MCCVISSQYLFWLCEKDATDSSRLSCMKSRRKATSARFCRTNFEAVKDSRIDYG